MPAAAERPFAPAPRQPGRPPERVAAGPLVLRRVRADDAGVIAVAVRASLDHLRPWMPWATPEAADLRSQLVRVAEADELWDSGTGFIYVMIARDAGPPGGPGAVTDPDGEFAGTIGLHRRLSDDAVEIGYWTAAGKTRRGYATAAARALTQVALALPGTRQVEIHCDQANTASAAIPRKLGYRLDRVEAHEREAPGELGRRMIWVRDPADGPRAAGWPAGPTGRALAGEGGPHQRPAQAAPGDQVTGLDHQFPGGGSLGDRRMPLVGEAKRDGQGAGDSGQDGRQQHHRADPGRRVPGMPPEPAGKAGHRPDRDLLDPRHLLGQVEPGKD